MTNKRNLFSCSTPIIRIFVAASLVCLFSLSGCVSVPPQVIKTHQKELEIIEALRKSHIEMVDAYVDEKLQNFEKFFFDDYGPVYLKHWQKSFKTTYSRDYDPKKDFSLLYSDLVAEYQDLSTPIEQIRYELKAAITTEYSNAIAAHQAVDRWLESLEKLNKSQRGAIDALLTGIKPGLSLDSVDQAIKEATDTVKKKIDEYIKN